MVANCLMTETNI